MFQIVRHAAQLASSSVSNQTLPVRESWPALHINRYKHHTRYKKKNKHRGSQNVFGHCLETTFAKKTSLVDRSATTACCPLVSWPGAEHINPGLPGQDSQQLQTGVTHTGKELPARHGQIHLPKQNHWALTALPSSY